MAVSTEDIKLLRESTGAGVLDCKKALQETDGDIDQAIDYLRRKGLAAASKKASREAKEGLISALVSDDSQTGAMVEVNCETDFVARTDDFKNLVGTLVRQVLAQPSLNSASALLEAPYIDDNSKTVRDYVTGIIAKLGENIVVRRVACFEVGGQGIIESYIHIGGRVGVLVEATGGDRDDRRFVELVHDVALQIAAASPRYISEADVPADIIASERDVYREQLAEDKKPDNIKERIIDGKLSKWYAEVALLNQEFVKDNSTTIGQLIEKVSRDLGTQVKIQRFTRFELGASD